MPGPLDNVAIAAVFDEMADLLEIQEANPFRIRAYRNGARTVAEETRPLADRVAGEVRGEEKLTDLPGIGKDLAAQIRDLVAKGESDDLIALRRDVPAGLIDLLRLPGLGPKRARRLWQDLGVIDLTGFAQALTEGRVDAVEGFGPKSIAKLRAAVERGTASSRRYLLSDADEAVATILRHLSDAPGLSKVAGAGSWRRRRETVGDLDLVAVARDAEPVMDRFVSTPGVARVEARGSTRATVVLHSGLQVDLRVVPQESFGAAMVYFTGSKAHNVKMRQRAVERGLRVSEYGVFRGGDVEADGPLAGRRVAGATEEDVYAAAGLPWFPPELREDRGELELAARDEPLPELIETAAIRGDLQMHTTWSDGKNTLEEMVEACARRGYAYLAVTDHSPALAMIRGLDARKLRSQRVEIEAVQARHPRVRILRSLEVDILADGRLDMDEESLATLDLIVVSVHSRFDLEPEAQTARILHAIEQPGVSILAHPTGRRLLQRQEMRFDVERVLERCAELGVAVEANAHPDRLDFKDTHLERARELGVRVVISTDAHSVGQLDNLRYGVDQARRAGLEKRHVLNALPLAKFLKTARRPGVG